MRTLRAAMLSLVLVTCATAASGQSYRWVDDEGNVNYAGARDQVPERYRSQLPAEVPREPDTPDHRLTPDARRRASTECVLRIMSAPGQSSVSRSYPNCVACGKAIEMLGRDERGRARCVAARAPKEPSRARGSD